MIKKGKRKGKGIKRETTEGKRRQRRKRRAKEGKGKERAGQRRKRTKKKNGAKKEPHPKVWFRGETIRVGYPNL